MNDQERKGILHLGMMAAFADGYASETERGEIARIAAMIGCDPDQDLAPLYEDVVVKRVSVADAVAELKSSESKALALEVAGMVSSIDAGPSQERKDFLDALRAMLHLDPHVATSVRLADGPVIAARSVLSADEMDRLILEGAILNGALELLPEPVARMAIVPLQMNLVRDIGKSYGYPLAAPQIADMVAAMGAGFATRWAARAANGALGTVLGALGGGFLRFLGVQALDSGTSFVTTYAIGHVARRYYQSGRKLNREMIEEAFCQLMDDAKRLQLTYLPRMEAEAQKMRTA